MPETPNTETSAAQSQDQMREAAFKWLNEAPPEEILRNTRLGGIVGQRMNSAREQARRDAEVEISERERQRAEAEFDRLANDDPAEFSRRYLTAKEQERIARQQAQLTEDVQKEFTNTIGAAFQSLAEWQDVTPEEFAKLQQALANKQGKEVLAAFTVTMTDLIAERKSSKKFSDFRAKELDKEREALRSEEAAKLLHNSERPDISNGASTRARFDPSQMSDKDFDKWYRSNLLGRV